MSSLGYKTHPPALELTPLSSLPKNGKLLFQGLKQIFNGYLGGPGSTGTLHTELGVACEIVMVAALLTLLAAGARSATSFVLSRRRVDSPTTPTQLATTLHTIYWVSSAIMACAGFVFSTFGPYHESFYMTVTFSVAAVTPLFLYSDTLVRWLIPVGASIFFVGSLVGLESSNTGSPAVLAPYEKGIVNFALANSATVGYGGDRDASSFTWGSHERVVVRPVYTCWHPGGGNLCIFPQETVPSWYAPKQQFTFLLARHEELGPPEGFGRPLAVESFGPATMFIYPYDIASRFGPPTG